MHVHQLPGSSNADIAIAQNAVIVFIIGQWVVFEMLL